MNNMEKKSNRKFIFIIIGGILILIAIFCILFFKNNVVDSVFNNKTNGSQDLKSKIKFKEATFSQVTKVRKGIVNENNGTFLYDDNGNLLKHYLYKTGNDYYYSNGDGRIVAGTFVAIDARTNSNVDFTNTDAYWYYFDYNGKAMRNMTRTISGKKLEFGYNGRIISSDLPNELKDYRTKNFDDKNIGDRVSFGAYEEKNNGEYAYLSWDVIDKKDDKLLLATCYIVDEKKVDANYNWRDSELRQWLNNDFLNKTFKTEDEYEIICETDVETEGIITKDKIFLLSEEEVDKYYKNNLSEYKTTLATPKLRSKLLTFDYKSPYCLRDGVNGDIKVVSTDGKIYLSKDYNWYLNELEQERYDALYESMIQEYDDYMSREETSHYLNEENIEEENIEEDDYYIEERPIYNFERVDYNVYGIRPAIWVRIGETSKS